MLSSSRGQANFWGLEASRPRPRTWPSRPRPRTSKCVLEDVLEVKDVLKDSTSVNYFSQKRCYIILSINLIKMMGILSCPTDFFIGNKLTVPNSSRLSIGWRNIEKETLSIKYRVTLWLLLFSIFPASGLAIVQKKFLKCSAIATLLSQVLPSIFYTVLLGREFAFADFFWRNELVVFHILRQLFLFSLKSLWEYSCLGCRLTFVNLLE